MQGSTSLHGRAIMAVIGLGLIAASATAARAGVTTYVCAMDSGSQKLAVDSVKHSVNLGEHTLKTRRLKNGGVQWSANGWGCTLDPKALTLFCESDAGASEVKCTTPAPQ